MSVFANYVLVRMRSQKALAHRVRVRADYGLATRCGVGAAGPDAERRSFSLALRDNVAPSVRDCRKCGGDR